MSGTRVEKIVGKNKEADRQIIFWIIYKVYEVIDNVLKQITKDSTVKQIKDDLLMRFKNLGACQVPTTDIKIFNTGINNDIKAYQNKKIEELSAGFKKKYNSFSKSLKHSKIKKLVLNFFKSLEKVIQNKKVGTLDDVIREFSECCNQISYTSLDKSSALFDESKVTNGKFREDVGAMTETFKKLYENELGELIKVKKATYNREKEINDLGMKVKNQKTSLNEVRKKLEDAVAGQIVSEQKAAKGKKEVERLNIELQTCKTSLKHIDELKREKVKSETDLRNVPQQLENKKN